MHVKTMEGLAGASTNMKLLNTPFRVYKEARRRGDQAVMERAMGYTQDFAGKAEEYQKKAEKGMEEDAKAAKEKAEADRRKAVEKRREDRERLENRIEESKAEKAEDIIVEKTGEGAGNKAEQEPEKSGYKNSDTVEISESGKAVWSENGGRDFVRIRGHVPGAAAEAGMAKPAVYIKTGEIAQAEAGANISVSI